MKIGYSILLGEVLPAGDIDYDDCRRMQIVCAECQEPVFKVCREKDRGATLDYFSHYNRKYSVDTDCQARVATSITDEHRKKNATSREQRLKYFLSVLPTAVGRHPLLQKGGMKIVEDLRRSPGYREFCRRLVDKLYRRCPPSHRSWLFDEVALLYDGVSEKSRDDLPEPMRYRIARDLFDLLMKQISRGALLKLLDLALYRQAMVCRTEIEFGRVNSLEDASALSYGAYQRVCCVRRKDVGALIKEMEATPTSCAIQVATGVLETPSLFDWFCEFALTSVVHDLVALPYGAILRDRYGDAEVERQHIQVYGPESFDVIDMT